MAKIQMIKESEAATYKVGRAHLDEEEILRVSKEILLRRLESRELSLAIKGADDVKKYLNLLLLHEDTESVWGIFMDSKHRVIETAKMSMGTVRSAPIYPRHFAKKAIELNATAVIMVHNHPSGSLEPSDADIETTKKVKKVLDMIEVNLIDHFIMGNRQPYSMVEHGRM